MDRRMDGCVGESTYLNIFIQNVVQRAGMAVCSEHLNSTSSNFTLC